MTPTSKPAVTPEMVEKARLGCPNRNSDSHHQYGYCQACQYAASAVQDAVSECANLAEVMLCTRGLRATGREMAAALREKYGVSQRKGDTNGY